MAAGAARRWAWILAGTLPVAALALAGGYVLTRYLAMRDRLGAWPVTLSDDRGTVLGSGTVVFTATSWSARWSWSAPFVTFDAELAESAGAIALNDAGEAAMKPLFLGGRHLTCEHASGRVGDPGRPVGPLPSDGVIRLLDWHHVFQEVWWDWRPGAAMPVRSPFTGDPYPSLRLTVTG